MYSRLVYLSFKSNTYDNYAREYILILIEQLFDYAYEIAGIFVCRILTSNSTLR